MEEVKIGDVFGDNSSTQEDHLSSTPDVQKKDVLVSSHEIPSSVMSDKFEQEHSQNNEGVSKQESDDAVGNQTADQNLHEEKKTGLVPDGIETSKLEDSKGSSKISVNHDQGQFYDWPEKAVALTNLVKEKSAVAVSTLIRRLSGKKDEDEQVTSGGEEINASVDRGSHEDEAEESESKMKDDLKDNFIWNPLNFIKIPWDLDMRSNTGQESSVYSEHLKEELLTKGRIIVYTKLQCQDSKDVRLFMHQKRLKYIEINVDIYPSRKLELEKITGSPDVPRIFFNDLLIGSLSELKDLNESGKIDDDGDDDYDGDDEEGKILIQQIVDRMRKSSSVALHTQKMLFALDGHH